MSSNPYVEEYTRWMHIYWGREAFFREKTDIYLGRTPFRSVLKQAADVWEEFFIIADEVLDEK